MSLVARGLSRTFKKHVAVADATLTLSPGRITGLVGPNGAGKTTLLLMLAGLLQPSSGTIELDGAPVAPSACAPAWGGCRTCSAPGIR